MFFSKIEENRENFTKSERKLVEYIQDNSHKLINYNVLELAEKTGVSAPSIIRFAKKLGYDGFIDMRIALGKFSAKNSEKEKTYNSVIEFYRSSLLNTLNFLEERQLEQALKLLRGTGKIAVLGCRGSEAVAKEFHRGLLLKEQESFFELEIENIELILKKFSRGDILTIFSHHGDNHEVLELIKSAKERDVTVVAVTKAEKNRVGMGADINLKTDNSERTFRINQSAVAETILENL